MYLPKILALQTNEDESVEKLVAVRIKPSPDE
jgi:hypothetical protein